MRDGEFADNMREIFLFFGKSELKKSTLVAKHLCINFGCD